MAKLGDYANFIMGQAPASSECNSNGVGTPFVKAGQFGLSTPVIDEWTTNPLKMASNKDILICVVGATSGKLNRGVECAIGRSVAAIRPNEKTIRDYIYYGLHPWIKRLRGGSQGSAIGVITKDMLDAVEMPFPGKERQKEIVKTLSLIENIIEKRKEELKKFDTLIKARFVEMFGDPETSEKYPHIAVKKLTDVISGGTPDRKNNAYWENGMVPWVKTTELQNNRLSNIEEYITEKGLSESSAKVVPEGTVLIAMYGQGKTRGMTAILDVPASTNQACACLLPSEKVEAEYLWQYMIMSYDRLRNLAQGGNQPNLNGNMIKNFTVLVPPKYKQIEFVGFINQINKSKVAVQKALDETQMLFDCLMQEYFG